MQQQLEIVIDKDETTTEQIPLVQSKELEHGFDNNINNQNDKKQIIQSEILQPWKHSFCCYPIHMSGTKEEMLERFWIIKCRFLWFCLFYQLLLLSFFITEIVFAIRNSKTLYVYLFSGFAVLAFFGFLANRYNNSQWEIDFASKLFFATGYIRLRGVPDAWLFDICLFKKI